MTKQLSDKEKALLILEESQKKFEESEEQFKELTKVMLGLKIALEHSERLLKRIINELSNKNRQLKKDRFICLDCKYCGYTEIGCLCEKQDHWEDFKSECNDFEKLKY